MPSALILRAGGPAAPPLAEDLAAVGIAVAGDAEPARLLRDVIRIAPDLVIIATDAPDDALFEGIAAVQAAAALPVVVFTDDPDAEKIASATRSGVHAYVVSGYGRNRLRSVIHLAQARFRHEQLLRTELAGVTQKFAERKLVDRAKGILMGTRQLREEEAFRALRNAAMHTKQRLGQVAQQVIDAARYGEAINRAGQLRMLSQRLVKLYALGTAGTRPAETAGLFAVSLAQIDQNLAILTRGLSAATFGDLLAAVLLPWQTLRAALAAPAGAAMLPEIDRLAEALLTQAEQLTENLEVAGFASALRVINVSGRQRMLSQRVAKAALMAMLLPGAAGRAARNVARASEGELVAGLAYLGALPMSNPDIDRELAAAQLAWTGLSAALAGGDRDGIAGLSETLLGHFDRLTDHLERGMHALIR